MSASVLAPVGVRGMKVLDREKFLRNVQVPVLKVTEEKLAKVTPICKPYFLKMENFKPVQNFQDETSKKCIHLNPEKVSSWTDISQKDRECLSQHDINESNFQTKELQIKYENWKFEEIFKAVLPENEEMVSSFSTIGHIIHLNLKEHLLDYRPLIGQVLVDKIKTCRTVVNKSNIIDNTYRNFSMEVIAGDEDFLVTVKENRCNFQFDFSKVYWNPRLGKEHERILDFLKLGDVLFDVFCGVGPFSVPAAKRKCKVFANDLNPDSFKWLNHNAKHNKVNSTNFQSYNLDGKDFICTIFRDYITEYCKGNEKLKELSKIHITMNLPAMAVKFLKYFCGIIKDQELLSKLDREIIVYVYCFAVGEDPVSVAKKMVIDNIGTDISSDILDVFDVRNVSPKKEMMRVTFRLTKDVLSGVISDNSEPPLKKICVEQESSV
ncbi:tRNA (guanine(37)-N1)-methyltransferase isoform X1 [Pectinophora gossypiella]|uniref:tRNA (guanine(37)-N1)-methyltransferase isoform X1 n=1 Tax=Pectinophora gossypiella TaxID=13191 RepID=UPI00214F3FD2|nr:tRNA (guanine(37)-N1)-methyltransferase isoform X1 [Pectinophora gossypiella]